MASRRVTTGAALASFGAAERPYASIRRRRPAEEEALPRDRAGADAALGARAHRTHRAAQGRDRAVGGRYRQEAGDAVGGRSLLQEVARGRRRSARQVKRSKSYRNRCDNTARLN